MNSPPLQRRTIGVAFFTGCFFILAAFFPLIFPQHAPAQDQRPAFTSAEKAIADQIHGLRAMPDDVRARTTKSLAIQIRQLPVTPNKLVLANDLASRATEGDFGHDALQEVATTLAEALRERPVPTDHGQPAEAYVELAELVRYEHVQASSDDPQFAAAMSKLAVDDASREHADFTLADLGGKIWSLQQLRGKVVLVNFWATWCPPCRKEMPDLDALYRRFQDQGLIVLAISDEDVGKVKPFIAEHRVSYPILLDPGRKVNEQFQVDGIPKSFVYDRSGKLVAESIDMRTQRQFLQMLAEAGLQ
jgi:peroxiredoxin